MICAIMQPTYLPWAGYFNLMSQVDTFIFLDDAQFEKGSWHHRNRVLVNGEPHWLSVPTRRLFLGQTIQDIELDAQSPWRQKHLRLLEQVYGKHPFASALLAAAAPIGDVSLSRLDELNVALIRGMADALKLRCRILRSSELGVEARRTDRIIGLCQAVGADAYLSPVGARGYLEADRFTDRTTIRLTFQDYAALPYDQRGAPTFVSHLSLLDAVANLGWEGASAYVARGTVPPIPTFLPNRTL